MVMMPRATWVGAGVITQSRLAVAPLLGSRDPQTPIWTTEKGPVTPRRRTACLREDGGRGRKTLSPPQGHHIHVWCLPKRPCGS